ncbi:endonuclease/exonuclease/phosphatase family protein [soil metagenome]
MATAIGPDTASVLRVVSYNIRAGTDLHGQPNLERVAALLDSLGAEVVLLQEVDRGTVRSGGVDQLGELERLTGMTGFFAAAMDFDGGEYGTALLSRHAIHDARSIPLPVRVTAELAHLYYEPRSLLNAVVETPVGRIHVLGTHLAHQGGPSFRQPQMFQILAYVAETVPAHMPVIFAGDLNATPDAPEIRALSLHFTDAWLACGSGAGNTFPSDRPVRRIDYILTRGVHCSSAAVIATEVSDHRPLVADLRPNRR